MLHSISMTLTKMVYSKMMNCCLCYKMLFIILAKTIKSTFKMLRISSPWQTSTTTKKYKKTKSTSSSKRLPNPSDHLFIFCHLISQHSNLQSFKLISNQHFPIILKSKINFQLLDLLCEIKQVDLDGRKIHYLKRLNLQSAKSSRNSSSRSVQNLFLWIDGLFFAESQFLLFITISICPNSSYLLFQISSFLALCSLLLLLLQNSLISYFQVGLFFLFEFIMVFIFESRNRWFSMFEKGMFFPGYFLKPFDVSGLESIFLHPCLLQGLTHPPQLVELAMVLQNSGLVNCMNSLSLCLMEFFLDGKSVWVVEQKWLESHKFFKDLRCLEWKLILLEFYLDQYIWLFDRKKFPINKKKKFHGISEVAYKNKEKHQFKLINQTTKIHNNNFNQKHMIPYH